MSFTVSGVTVSILSFLLFLGAVAGWVFLHQDYPVKAGPYFRVTATVALVTLIGGVMMMYSFSTLKVGIGMFVAIFLVCQIIGLLYEVLCRRFGIEVHGFDTLQYNKEV